jgi:hypothetical protein
MQAGAGECWAMEGERRQDCVAAASLRGLCSEQVLRTLYKPSPRCSTNTSYVCSTQGSELALSRGSKYTSRMEVEASSGSAAAIAVKAAGKGGGTAGSGAWVKARG